MQSSSQNNHQPVVVASGLRKFFGNRKAVQGIDFSINRGECFGFLGPNGAGKTTTIKIMLGLVEKSGGSLMVFGESIPERLRQIKARVGVVPQNDNLDTDFTVLENLLTFASYYKVKRKIALQRATDLLKFFALDNRRDDLIDELSGGQRRRLLLARALIHDPELLILDEPTVGLDPQARQLIWQRLKSLKEQGVTMMLTSHYMDEVARLSDRILILDQGEVVAQGQPQQMVNEMVGQDVFEIICEDTDLLQLEAIAISCDARSERVPEGLLIYTQQECSELESHIRALSQWIKRPANLEDLFIKLTGRTLQES